jgi:hypothetical protein
MAHQVADQRPIIRGCLGACAIADSRGLHHVGIIGHVLDQADKAVVQALDESARTCNTQSSGVGEHRGWVCPMYEPFMEWLYTQDLSDIKVLPHLVTLGPEADKHCAMQGYRREGRGLQPGTLEFAREQLRRAIQRFYDDPDEYLAVSFDKRTDAELCGQPVAEFRLTATELGLDFDQIIAANQYIVADVERLKKFVAQALEAKA